MKKIFFGTALLTSCCGIALAGGYYSGPYLSVGAGMVDNVFDFNQSGSITSSNSTTAITSSNNGDQLSATGSIGAGYRIRVNSRTSLGFEVNANFENGQGETSGTVVNSTSLNINNHLQSKLSTSFSLLFKPGMLMNNQKSLVYLLIGPQWGEFSSSSWTRFAEVIPSASSVAVGSISSSDASSYKFGWVAGIGVEEDLNDNFHIGIEYQYASYNNVYSSNATNSVFENGAANGSISGNASADAHTNTILLKITRPFS